MEVKVIPNGVDTGLYRPMDRAIARERLGLPTNRKLIMFCAVNATTERNKGFECLQVALRMVSRRAHDVDAIVVGAGAPKAPPDLGLPVHYVGHCHDDVTLALYYCAADVVVIPSEEENLPNTILEAMASGTPCVAFRVGGIPDMIRNEVNGCLAKPRDPEDLCRGISFVLEDHERWMSFSEDCRTTAVREYDVNVTAKRHAALYEEILGRH